MQWSPITLRSEMGDGATASGVYLYDPAGSDELVVTLSAPLAAQLRLRQGRAVGALHASLAEVVWEDLEVVLDAELTEVARVLAGVGSAFTVPEPRLLLLRFRDPAHRARRQRGLTMRPLQALASGAAGHLAQSVTIVSSPFAASHTALFHGYMSTGMISQTGPALVLVDARYLDGMEGGLITAPTGSVGLVLGAVIKGNGQGRLMAAVPWTVLRQYLPENFAAAFSDAPGKGESLGGPDDNKPRSSKGLATSHAAIAAKDRLQSDVQTGQRGRADSDGGNLFKTEGAHLNAPSTKTSDPDSLGTKMDRPDTAHPDSTWQGVVSILIRTGPIVTWGSGVLIAPDTVATNNHVVHGIATDRIEVWAGPSHQRFARAVRRPLPGLDLVLVSLDRPIRELPPVTIATADPEIGTTIRSVGFGLFLPRPLSLPLESRGIVSQSLPGMLVTSAGCWNGSSGGGIFNSRGELVGIMASNARDNVTGEIMPDLSMSIPASVIRKAIAGQELPGDLAKLWRLEPGYKDIRARL